MKPSSKQKRPTVTERRSADALGPLIRYAATNRGALAQIAEELSRRTRKKQFAANVGTWLDSDPNKRAEPRLGLGLFLLDIQTDLDQGKWVPA
jgi:hypothetical protein